jgi:hypothetical protein
MATQVDKLTFSGAQRIARITLCVLESDELLHAVDRCNLINALIDSTAICTAGQIAVECRRVADENSAYRMIDAQILRDAHRCG